MFSKKDSDSFGIGLDLHPNYSSQSNLQISKSAHLNHQFFLLVRQKHFEQAYILGVKILKESPNNPAIAKFCQYIQANFDDLTDMVEEQQAEDSGEESSEYQSQEEGEEEKSEEDSIQKKIKNISLNSRASLTSQITLKGEKKLGKNYTQTSNKQVNPNKQNAHTWQHTCKNPNCPNKKPHKSHK